MNDPVLRLVNEMFDQAFQPKESRLGKKLRLEDELGNTHWDFIEASELIDAVTCNFKHRYQGGLNAELVEQRLRDLRDALEAADANVAEIPHELDDPE